MSDDTNSQDPDLETLITYLHENRDFDFGGYKRSSLRRRISKRMQEVGVENFPGYIEFLEANPDEFQALFDTILINVTDFFRDRDAWDVIADKVLPAVLKNWSEDRQIRAWCAGCATGEEPYSLAMLLCEAMGEDAFLKCVRIYATDIDEDALRSARTGRYTEKSLASVPAKLRRKYFSLDGDSYVFRRDLRRVVVFGRHNLVTDAPISRVNLLLCRNLLIYLDLKTQKQVIPRLHYALANDGILFLGKAETLLARSPLFSAVDTRHRIFTKVGTSPERSDVMPWTAAPDIQAGPVGRTEEIFASQLSTLPSAHILLDDRDHIVFANTAACRWFQLSQREFGHPFQDLEVSFRPIELRRMVQEARETLQPQKRDKVLWRAPEGEEIWLQSEVTPLLTQAGQLRATAINIYDVSETEQKSKELQETAENLETTTEELQSSNEELETTNEELQSTNEELETTNEELQSTNEELETTNEELRSANEELRTVNDSLNARSIELEAYRSSMERLLASIRFGVVGVDGGDRVTYWNPESEDMWGLRADEVLGHSLYDLDTNMPLAEFKKQIDSVKKGAQPRTHVEFEARDRRGRAMDCRLVITPLRVDTDTPYGALLLVEDITERKQHVRDIEKAREYAENVIATLHEPLLVLGDKLTVVSVNASFLKTFSLTPEQTVGTSIFTLANGAWNIPELRNLLERVIPENTEVSDFPVEHDFPGLGRRVLLLNGRRFSPGDGTTQRILLAIRDVTDQSTPAGNGKRKGGPS